MHIQWNVIFAGAILMYQVVVCSCFQLLHRQPSSACSKRNTGLLKKQDVFSPAIQLQTVPLTKHPFYLSSMLLLSACFIGDASRLQGAGPGPGPWKAWLHADLCGEQLFFPFYVFLDENLLYFVSDDSKCSVFLAERVS